MHYLKIKELAAEFRKDPTEAEQYLWTFLRKRKLSGKKFLRQHPIIYEVIELDGGVHDTRVEKE
jgi:very-short-patch-repair endonuclease